MLGRYEALLAAGKHANKAKVAVVNEEIRWVWRIGLSVQQEMCLIASGLRV